MRFLTDQDVYGSTVRFLRLLGHDVATATELGLSQSTDSALLAEAQTTSRILITRDRDFGWLVFQKRQGYGVIYLRINPPTVQIVHAELKRVIAMHNESLLLSAFVVVGPGRHRIRLAGV